MSCAPISSVVVISSANWLRSASVMARQKSIVLEIDYGNFLKLAESNSHLLLRVIEQLSKKLNEMTTRARQFVHMSAQERVLYVLRDIASQASVELTDQGHLVAITKNEIGNMAGCSRETASRALRDLEVAGKIVNSGRKVLVKAQA